MSGSRRRLHQQPTGCGIAQVSNNDKSGFKHRHIDINGLSGWLLGPWLELFWKYLIAAPPSSCQAPKLRKRLLCLLFSSALHLYSLHGPCFTDFLLYQGLCLISADTLNAIAVGWNLRYHLNVRKEVCVWPDNQTALCLVRALEHPSALSFIN